MKASSYLKSLIPSFGRDQVLEDIRITRTEIKDVTQPAYEEAEKLFKGWKFKSAPLVANLATFDRLVKHAGNENAVQVISKSWRHVLENLDDVEELVKKSFNEEVAAAGLTYLKANLLQFSECVAFVSKFARKFLIYIYVCETAEYEESGVDLSESLTPAEMEWISANFISFCTALNITSGNAVVVRKQMADIPEINITADNEETLAHTVGATKIDPFQMGLIPIKLNPIYHIRMFVAEWQANRYKAAKDELRYLELRKLNLEKLSEGKQDVALQKQIQMLEGRIHGLNYKLSRMEKDYG